MTNQIKITKENAIAQVQSSVSSIFTKDDVLFLLNAIEQEKVKASISEETIEKLVSQITAEIVDQNDRGRLFDTDNAEFELYGNRIELTSVCIDEETIGDIVREALTDEFEAEEEEEEAEEEKEEESSF
jgi:hypothetical protein